jgi:hypothetical protein
MVRVEARYFRVRADDGNTYVLSHTEVDDVWRWKINQSVAIRVLAGTQRIHRQDVESQQMRIPRFFSLADSATYSLFGTFLRQAQRCFCLQEISGLCVNIEGAPATGQHPNKRSDN